MIQLIHSAMMPGSKSLVDVWIGADGVISAVTPASSAPHGLPEAQVLNAEGRVLTSGLWDEHVHLTQWAQQSSRPDFFECNSAEDALALVTQLLTPDASGTTPQELIGMRTRGGHWGGLTKEQLDAVSGDIPVILVGLDLHSGWLNSAALRKYGFPEDRAGQVVETEFFELAAQLDRFTDGELDVLVFEAAKAAAALGVVGVVDLEIRWSYDDWIRRENAGFDLLRVESGVYPELLDRAIGMGLRSGSPIGDSGFVNVGPMKVITDGSLGTRTAYCCAPYLDVGGHGRELVSLSELTELLTKAKRHGYHAAVHAIGDRANTQALDAFESTGAEGGIEHAQLIRPEDVDRFAKLGVRASVQPSHISDDAISMTAVWGDFAKHAFPLQSLLRSGAKVVLSSDAPVGPLDPWLAISGAISRSQGDGTSFEPNERLTIEQALACSMRGPLQPGAGDVADLVLLDADPLDCSVDDFAAPGVAATLIAGNLTHLAL